jgi:hypothetical protein
MNIILKITTLKELNNHLKFKIMTRTTKPTSLVENHGTRTQMIRNAMSHNKFLTWQFLRFKSNEELLCFTHPGDRLRFATELNLDLKRQVVQPE